MNCRLRRSCTIASLLLFVALVQPAWASWSTTAYLSTPPIAPGTSVEKAPASIPDGSGGAFIVWQDGRSLAAWNVIAQHVLANGTSDPAWPAAGLVLAPSAFYQTAPKIIADGTGGVIVCWSDARNAGDVYVQRVTGAGAIAPGWPAGGVGVATTAVGELNPSICTDGAGGVIVVYEYVFSSLDHDIYAARVTSAGTLVPWAPVYSPTSDSRTPVVAPDGSGGCYVAFSDNAGPSLVQIRAGHLDATGAAIYAPNQLYGFPPYQEYTPLIDVDGMGGAFVAWIELGSGDDDVFITRVGPNQAPVQPFYGNAVRVSGVVGSNQDLTGLAYDGAGGALVTWNDYRYGSTSQAFAMRVLTNAQTAPGWPINGVPVGYTGLGQYNPVPVPDGTGGGTIVWSDLRGGYFGGALYATRFTATGALAPHWTPGGTLCVTGNISGPDFTACPDARRGAIVAVQDFRASNLVQNLFAARMDRYGALGDVQPSLAGIKDVPADQGGKVKLAWNACLLDTDPSLGIGSYWIWRQAPSAAAALAVRAGARWIEDLPAAAPVAGTIAGSPDAAIAAAHATGLYRHAEGAAAAYAWEYVATQPANASSQYSYVAATTGDSTAGHNPYTPFMVEAHDAASSAFWDSAPDSGYSVDNLAPAKPAPFAGTYGAGAAHLHWGANTEPDLFGYRLYAGTSAGFVPGPGSLVVAKPDTGFVATGAAGSFYKLSAVDIHGNESAFALLTPGTISGVDGGALPQALSLAAPWPNPARDEALLSFALPGAAPVTLSVYDTGGRRVRTVLSGRMDAGEYQVPFDLRDAGGRQVRSGLYFVRLEAGTQTRVRRLAIVQ